MKYIAIFCSAETLDEKYIRPAKEFATLLAKNGYGLVWGGSDHGLMSVISNAVKDGGGRLVGVSLEVLKHMAKKDAHEMTIAKNLSERRTTMLEKADAVAMLVGGIGTLDEVTEALELNKQIHKGKIRPVVALNTDHFYEGLRVQLQKMKNDGFIKHSTEDVVYFADTPIEAIEFINKSLI